MKSWCRAGEEILRELHDTLDSMEVYLKRIARLGSDGDILIDLLLQLRKRINAQLSQRKQSPS